MDKYKDEACQRPVISDSDDAQSVVHTTLVAVENSIHNADLDEETGFSFTPL